MLCRALLTLSSNYYYQLSFFLSSLSNGQLQLRSIHHFFSCISGNEGHLCDEQCDGCWGPGNRQCQACRNYTFKDMCIQSCKSLPMIYDAGNKTCEKCHSQCESGCTGPVRNFSCSALGILFHCYSHERSTRRIFWRFFILKIKQNLIWIKITNWIKIWFK